MKTLLTFIGMELTVLTLLLLGGCDFRLADVHIDQRKPQTFAGADLSLLELSWLQTLNGKKELLAVLLIDPGLAARLSLDMSRNCIQLVSFDSGDGETIGDFVSAPCEGTIADPSEVRFSFRPYGVSSYDYHLILEDPDVIYGRATVDPSTSIVTLVELCAQNCTVRIQDGLFQGVDLE